MGDGGGEGVCGIGFRCFTQAELGADHEGHLVFLRRAAPHGGLFDLTWGIFVDWQAVLGGGDQAGTACGAQHDGGLVALDKNGGFDGAHRRCVPGDHFIQTGADGDQTAGGKQGGFVVNDAPFNCP